MIGWRRLLPCRGRFAPTPTGPLHLGNARTALVAWLSARAAGGLVAMRVEDADRLRVRAGLEASILADLRWLGLDWDEGPDRGGPAAPYRQSERMAHYAAALDRLRQDGLAYPCLCSRAEIAAAAQAPHGPADDGPRYPGTCGRLGVSEIRERASRQPPAWRFRVPEGPVRFADRLQGPQEFDVAAATGDFVVMRADRVPAYQLAAAVDDAAMGITEVVRGDDLLPSTARQLLLLEALGTPPPSYAHVGLVVGADGQRLAKRHGALSVGELRERGADPRALVGLLAMSCGLRPAALPCTPRDLVEDFRLERVRLGPVTIEAGPSLPELVLHR